LLVFEKYLASKNLNPKAIFFTYLGLKKGEDKTILLTEELKKSYIERITAICKKINLALLSDYFEKNQQEDVWRKEKTKGKKPPLMQNCRGW
jgi:predicted alpha/beta superfamily hydrolase